MYTSRITIIISCLFLHICSQSYLHAEWDFSKSNDNFKAAGIAATGGMLATIAAIKQYHEHRRLQREMSLIKVDREYIANDTDAEIIQQREQSVRRRLRNTLKKLYLSVPASVLLLGTATGFGIKGTLKATKPHTEKTSIREEMEKSA